MSPGKASLKKSSGNPKSNKEPLISIKTICRNELSTYQFNCLLKNFSEKYYMHCLGNDFGRAWEKVCPHLTVFLDLEECNLLVECDFVKLADVNEARCTLPLLIRFCDGFLFKYAGEFFRLDMDFFEQIKKKGEKGKKYGVGLYESRGLVELHPDYGKLLTKLSKITSTQWLNNSSSTGRSGKDPEDWCNFLIRFSHNAVIDLLRKETKCGGCSYFLPYKKSCVLSNTKKSQMDSKTFSVGCSKFHWASPGYSKIPTPDKLNLTEKILHRVESLAVKRLAKAGLSDKKQTSYRRHIEIIRSMREVGSDNYKEDLLERLKISIKELNKEIDSFKKFVSRLEGKDALLDQYLIDFTMDDTVTDAEKWSQENPND